MGMWSVLCDIWGMMMGRGEGRGRGDNMLGEDVVLVGVFLRASGCHCV